MSAGSWTTAETSAMPKDDPRGIIVDMTENGRDVRIVWWAAESAVWHDGPLGNEYEETQFKRFLLLPN